MKQIRQIVLTAISAAVCYSSFAQISFTNKNSKLVTPTFRSGCTVTVADMDGDGLDDICRLQSGHDLYIEYQQVNGQFQSVHIGDFVTNNPSSWSWGMCVADVDHNGHKDVIAGGNNTGVKLIKIAPNRTFMNMTTLPTSNFFLQNANFMDVNNDGWEDIFACDDNAASHIWVNNGSGGFTVSNIINFDVSSTDDSGNYGSIWTDYDNDGDVDLYIAKCRQGVNSSTDARRINVLFRNNGNGTFTEAGAAAGLRIGAQSWTANFGDIDNDGDLDVIVTNHDVASQLLRNNGNGTFTDITAGSGFNVTITPIESMMEDFDNDGFIDILITGDGQQLFRNNGNSTFTRTTNDFNANNILSFATGDLNHDGKIDIYTSYGSIYTTPSTSRDDVLYMNTTNNSNNFITFNLVGTTSTIGGLGARATIYGAWGKQVREVRAGESYGTCNSFHLHFGLGTATGVDSVVIKWPSGSSQTIVNPTINQFITVKQADCVSPDNVVAITGNATICPGQSVTLTAAAGTDYTYLWTNGATTQTISVNTPGDYSVKISAPGNNCTTFAPIVAVAVNPDETPTITVAGELTFCQGNTVQLSSSAANAYLWSTGDTTQTISVADPGSYTVSASGVCQLWPSSPITVNVLAAPAPTANDVTLTDSVSTVITATGNNLTWYDSPTAGNVLGSGPNYTTPVITDSTTFWVQDTYSYGGGTARTGAPKHSGTTYSGSTSNGYLIFNVLNPCVLKSVKVYTDQPGVRLIELRSSTGTVLDTLRVNITGDSMVVNLNFNLTPGTSYQLGTNAAQNNAVLGFTTPRLRRSDSGVAYPYTLANLTRITGNNFGAQYYYYFYDWVVEMPATECVSERTAVKVRVEFPLIPTGLNTIEGLTLNVSPNPSNGLFELKINSSSAMSGNLKVTDMLGKVVMLENNIQVNGTYTKTLDMTNMPVGIYLLNITTDGKQNTYKLIVE
jgi:hypothetical protein